MGCEVVNVVILGYLARTDNIYVGSGCHVDN